MMGRDKKEKSVEVVNVGEEGLGEGIWLTKERRSRREDGK